MEQSKLRIVEGCPFTHLLSASRFAKPSRYLCGVMGVEFSAYSYYELIEKKTFEIIPIFDLSGEPWRQAKAHRFDNGIWLLHPENPDAGIGLFSNERVARKSANQVRIPGTRIEFAELGESFKKFLAPLWESVNEMEDSFWRRQEIDHDQHEEVFRAGLGLLREIQSASTLIGACRLRDNHPYMRTF